MAVGALGIVLTMSMAGRRDAPRDPRRDDVPPPA
jgi:hypothetical protein